MIVRLEVINIRLAKGQFKFADKESSAYRVSIQTEPNISAAERVIELRERPGNSDFIADFKYYRNVLVTLECYYKSFSRDENWMGRDDVSFWLDTGKYEDLILYTDPQYVYKAVVTRPPNFNGNRALGKSVPFDFDVSLQPFKFDLAGLQVETIIEKKLIHNSKRYASMPLIKIYGEGAISIFINKDEFKMIGVQNHIEIDSFEKEVYRYDKEKLISQTKNYLGSKLPVLYPGDNEISWKGNVTKIELTPRWWTKI